MKFEIDARPCAQGERAEEVEVLDAEEVGVDEVGHGEADRDLRHAEERDPGRAGLEPHVEPHDEEAGGAAAASGVSGRTAQITTTRLMVPKGGCASTSNP